MDWEQSQCGPWLFHRTGPCRAHLLLNAGCPCYYNLQSRWSHHLKRQEMQKQPVKLKPHGWNVNWGKQYIFASVAALFYILKHRLDPWSNNKWSISLIQLTRWTLAAVQAEQTLYGVTRVVAAFGQRAVHDFSRRSFVLLTLWETSEKVSGKSSNQNWYVTGLQVANQVVPGRGSLEGAKSLIRKSCAAIFTSDTGAACNPPTRAPQKLFIVQRQNKGSPLCK